MKRTAALTVRGVWELLRYDIAMTLFGFCHVHRTLANCPVSRTSPETIPPDRIAAAMTCALSLYWKPVHCLQRSVATARLLRGHGIAGRLVIGFRETPFFSHAWVEVAGKVVNDSQCYKDRLRVLEVI